MDLAPIEPAVVFVPLEAVALRATDNKFRTLVRPPLLSMGTHGEITYRSSEQQGLSYEVFFGEGGRALPEGLLLADAERYLTVPANLSPKIPELAQAWIGLATEPVSR